MVLCWFDEGDKAVLLTQSSMEMVAVLIVLCWFGDDDEMTMIISE